MIKLAETNNIIYEIYNAIGSLLYVNKAIGQIGENKINISLTDFAPGIYFVKVRTSGGECTKKLIIQ